MLTNKELDLLIWGIDQGAPLGKGRSKQVLKEYQNLRTEALTLLALMDQVAIDTELGDETDRVFPHYEFNGLRQALGKE